MNAKKPDKQPSDSPEPQDIKLTPDSAEGRTEESVEQTRAKSKGQNPNKAPAKAPKQESSVDSKKKTEPKDAGGFRETQQFLKDTWLEFKKISWPDRRQVMKETWSVLVLVTIITAMVLAFDYVVGKAVFEPLDKFAKKMTSPIHQTQPMPMAPPMPGPPESAPAKTSTPPTPETPPDSTTR